MLVLHAGDTTHATCTLVTILSCPLNSRKRVPVLESKHRAVPSPQAVNTCRAKNMNREKSK